MEILIKTHFTNWHKVSKEQAKEYIRFMHKRIVAIKESDKADYINQKYLQGITVQELLYEE